MEAWYTAIGQKFTVSFSFEDLSAEDKIALFRRLLQDAEIVPAVQGAGEEAYKALEKAFVAWAMKQRSKK